MLFKHSMNGKTHKEKKDRECSKNTSMRFCTERTYDSRTTDKISFK
jgi:hypothetical protein